MQRDGQRRDTAQFPEEEVDEFALRLQCPEEMDVYEEEAQPDRVDEASGRDVSTKVILGFESVEYQTDPYYFSTRQSFLTPSMRATLLDWLQHLCNDFQFHRHTYYLAVNAVDRFLSQVSDVHLEEYQLLGLVCLHIASKIEEVTPRKLTEIARFANDGYSLAAIRSMERRIFHTLHWKIGLNSTPYSAFNLYTWKWDEFISVHPSAQRVLFHDTTETAYQRYSELVQVLDLAFMDIGALLFADEIIALGLLFIGVIRGNEKIEARVDTTFAEFLLTLGRNTAVRDLHPVLDFLFPFLDLPLATPQIPDGLVWQLYEDFLSCQTYNPHNLSFIRSRARLQR